MGRSRRIHGRCDMRQQISQQVVDEEGYTCTHGVAVRRPCIPCLNLVWDHLCSTVIEQVKSGAIPAKHGTHVLSQYRDEVYESAFSMSYWDWEDEYQFRLSRGDSTLPEIKRFDLVIPRLDTGGGA